MKQIGEVPGWNPGEGFLAVEVHQDDEGGTYIVQGEQTISLEGPMAERLAAILSREGGA